jgi:magnesium-protoporphyrin O-methyltransferase
MLGCQCEGLERQFGRDTAERDLRHFRRRGPAATTQLLVDDLRAAGINGASLLDIGGGIGAIHHLLLDAGAKDATHVDVSPDYLAAARTEAERRGHASRATFVHADFVEVAEELPPADVVTLDRVICCYPDMPRLVSLSAEKCRRLYGAVYPRDTWWMRMGLAVVNRLTQLRRCPFRVYLHSPAAIDAVIRDRGFTRIAFQRTFVWEVAVYSAVTTA